MTHYYCSIIHSLKLKLCTFNGDIRSHNVCYSIFCSIWIYPLMSKSRSVKHITITGMNISYTSISNNIVCNITVILSKICYCIYERGTAILYNIPIKSAVIFLCCMCIISHRPYSCFFLSNKLHIPVICILSACYVRR